MVVVAQLVEHRVVAPAVAGSIPVDYPILFDKKPKLFLTCFSLNFLVLLNSLKVIFFKKLSVKYRILTKFLNLIIHYYLSFFNLFGPLAQLARALHLHCKGHQFDSGRVHQILIDTQRYFR